LEIPVATTAFSELEMTGEKMAGEKEKRSEKLIADAWV